MELLKKAILIFILIVVIIGIICLIVNYFVVLSTKSKLMIADEAAKIGNVDCILILGAGVQNGRPSPMLEDRLLRGIELYEKGASNKIIVSGDHAREGYDEVNIMKKFIMDKGVPSSDIFMDHAGLNTYDSVYRAKEIFEVNKMIIVTQEYHLYRALYISQALGVEAYGVSSNPREYMGQIFRDIREVAARDKDFVKCIFKPKATILGSAIPVSGDGDITNDGKEV